MKRATSILILLTICFLLRERAKGDISQAQPAGPRRIVVKEYLSLEPLFITSTATLDPTNLARESWKGYLIKQPDPWGLMIGQTGLVPTLRFHFDNRALPWPSLKHHAVGDMAVNDVGAHALLHEMFGLEKDGDPAEFGGIGYLLNCTDPESGMIYSADNLPRNYPLGGEAALRVLLLYEQTKNPSYLEWAQRMLKTLRRCAIVYDRPGIGKVAAYNQGSFNVGEPPALEAHDPTIIGWEGPISGGIARAFCESYKVTRNVNDLEFAVALENRFCNSEDPDGDDGALRPDGSFGGKLQSGSWHMHGHTACLPGLVSVGEQLIISGRRDIGIKFITQASRTMDWLYDPARNPDAGSMTGWLGEWLMVATGWPRKTDCEGCTMGDVTQTACALGAASRLDPSLVDLERFYDRAEQIYSGQVVAQMFRLTPDYLAAVRECLTKRVDNEMTNALPEIKDREVKLRYEQAIKTAERMVGQQLGLCGFPDWANHLPSDLDSSLPGIHMQGCCSDATIRASHAIWSQTVTGDESETRVNMAFNRKSPLVDVASCLPHRAELNVLVKEAKKVLVRVPEWATKTRVKAYVGKRPVTVDWEQNYVVFNKTKSGQQLTVTYPLRIAEVKETVGGLDGTEYTERWRGNTIVDISPPGKWIPIFHRPELDNEDMPD